MLSIFVSCPGDAMELPGLDNPSWGRWPAHSSMLKKGRECLGVQIFAEFSESLESEKRTHLTTETSRYAKQIRILMARDDWAERPGTGHPYTALAVKARAQSRERHPQYVL